MKTMRTLILGASVPAAMAINQNGLAIDFAAASTSASASVHRLILGSPHDVEEFPWLLRGALPETSAPSGIPAEIAGNRSLLLSPRIKEQFPELTRVRLNLHESANQTRAESGLLASVIKNRSLAVSPSMREQFPELARGYVSEAMERTVKVAPVK